MAKSNTKADARRQVSPGSPGPASGADPIALVRGLAEVLDQHGLSELVYDTPATTITLRRGVTGALVAAPTVVHHAAPGPAHHHPAAAAPAPVAEDQGHVVTSPFVGTFYRRPNPDAATYTNVGDKVLKGQTLCIIEAMKLMNEIEADLSGTVTAVLVEDGSPVEYKQPLFRITPG
ncbi:MAG: acetyl-CoA carboxylase biotin carboxyl carrier protein [Kofleriaceae bacterium]|jgi:acetyl-CoA carboxylase biotin carboxyl carrier protein|nr:acetyl-CoA carboxylase biotin carboxyl carrier protein [Kofleriaceae bacterium]MBP6841508.1 acetyl-CoA carboxylase biotin carboxyl carrier protein [Kofleriaceae bacterium]